MTFGDKLKAARAEAGLKQSELASQLKTTANTISNWENNVSKPDLDTLSYICGVLHVKASYFLQPSIPEDEVSITELNFIKKYRSLDATGREHINTIMQWESARVAQIADLESRTAIADPAPISGVHARIYPYMHKIAAAGIGFYFDDIPTDTLEAPYREDADFIIGVSGDSMEPTYYDGDLVYVQKRQVVEPGDIGIFIVDGECYIKEAGEECLISHNPKYKPISGGKEINCVGKVLGKVVND